MGAFVHISLFLAVLGCVGAAVVPGERQLAPKADEVTVDCYPDAGSTEDGCLARGCVWQQSDVQNAPWCTFPSGYGYALDGDQVATTLGFTQNLKIKDGQVSLYGGDIANIRLTVEYWSETILRVKFDDPNNARYEVPIPLDNKPTTKPANVDYTVAISDDPQFGIVVTRKSTGAVVLNTNQPGFIFADQFLQTTTALPSSNFYGLGEQRHGAYPHDMNYRLWTAFSRDNPPQNDDNLYGVHPFYVNIENDGNANGIFLLNSNAMEFALQPSPSITWRTIGGVLDFYIYLGPTPEDVVKQHASLIGKPVMPSYWFLGYQLCRYGYKSTDEIRGIMQSMIDNQIPYDVQVTDIDAYVDWEDFTVNPNGFADMGAFVDELHQNGIRYMPIVDAAIGSDPSLLGNYPPLDDGNAMNVFVKQADGSTLQGQVWPGLTYFPDFSHVNATAYWTKELQYYYNTLNIHYDAIWLDMDEPSNFVSGSTTGCPANKYNNPPYPTHCQGASGGNLFDKTICMDATQADGLHYNTHSIYGHFDTKVTSAALQNVFPGKRPNILTRSNYVSTGLYSAHWLGDNNSEWSALRDSIPGILEYNLFGIAMVGADICGFQENTNLELCIRWTQLGAFYPYCRNHNSGDVAQDPPSLGQEMIDAAKLALGERYRLLPYLYTLLHDAYVNGGTVARGPAHEFPQDANTWGIDFHFLWGSALLISPVVDQGATSVDVYFPQARWFNYYTGAEVSNVGATSTVDAPLDGHTPVHIRGGFIVPQQEPGVTTMGSRSNPYALLVALDGNGAAQGSQYWDDGESIVPTDYTTLTFSLADGTLSISATGPATDLGAPLNTVTFYGVSASPESVTVDGADSAFTYDATNKVVTLANLGLALPATHTVSLN